MQTGVERMCKSIQANREVEMKIGIVSGFCIALLSELFLNKSFQIVLAIGIATKNYSAVVLPRQITW
jgi:hypothetical protein